MELQCGHIFCKTCLKSMKNPSNMSCPLCKKNMPRRACFQRNDLQELITCCNQMVHSFGEENQKMNETNTASIVFPMCELSNGETKTNTPCYQELPDLMDENVFGASASPYRYVASQVREPPTKKHKINQKSVVRKHEDKNKQNKNTDNKNKTELKKNRPLKTTATVQDAYEENTPIDKPLKPFYTTTTSIKRTVVIGKSIKTAPPVNKTATVTSDKSSLPKSRTLINGNGDSKDIDNQINNDIQISESEFPLDLSTPKQNNARPSLVRKTAIQFIKALDLTCKKDLNGTDESKTDLSKSCRLIEMADKEISIQGKSSNNTFDSEFDDLIGRNIELSGCKAGSSKSVSYSALNVGIERRFVDTNTTCVNVPDMNSSMSMKTPKRQSQNMGKRILSLEEVFEDEQSNKIQKVGIHEEFNSDLKIVNNELEKNNNQTEETYFSEEMEKNNDSEASDSEVLFLPETPVREVNVKRNSFRKSETKTAGEVDAVPLQSTSNNRNEQCSEFPLDMFDTSFDKIVEDHSSGLEQEIIQGDAIYPNSDISEKYTPPKRYLFCPTRLSRPQLVQLQKFCEICNGNISKEYTDDVTHLIINLEKDRVPQTMKYLFAIAGKKWVVTFDWISECIRENKVISENEYETANFPECDMGVRKSRNTTLPLFNDFNFYVAGNMRSSGATVEDCKKLLLKLGGNVIANPGDVNENVMIIGDPFDRSGTYQYWYNNCGWLTVSWEWILDCILTFTLVPFAKNHLITNLNGTGLSKAALPKALLSIHQF